jgi:hypothetical protein
LQALFAKANALATFFYPDYTVGPGVSPDHAHQLALVGFTTDRELQQKQPCRSPCPEGLFICNPIIAKRVVGVNAGF